MSFDIKTISPHELKEKIDRKEDIQIIDTRDKEDYEMYHLENAILIPREEVPDHVDRIARDKPVIFYCKFGMKSPVSIRYLQDEHGFTNLWSLKDGIFDWAKQIDESLLYLI